ncbi:MAG: DUF3782 domain-containing protein [Ignisphaera sp.]
MCVASTTNNSSLKSEFLRLLKEDEEFRYAIAGLIGFGEVLKRLDRHEEELKRLREDFLVFVKEQEKRWEENNRRWEENNKRWEENNRRWEENNRRWEEAYKRFEAIESELKRLREDFNRFVELEERRWEEINKRFTEVFARLEEHDRKFNEIVKRLEEHSRSLKRLEVSVGSLGRRLGIDLEKTILSLYKDVLKSFGVEGERVEKITIKDVNGVYYRKGAKLEMDIYVHDDKVFFIEVKSFADADDVEWFETRCEIFEKVLGRRPDRKIIVAVDILEDALKRAEELGIAAVYGNVIEEEKEKES